MGKRVIIKGASFAINAIGRVVPSTTYYNVIYNLSHCTASNNATSVEAGSTYEVTITANSGYNLVSVTVKHNGVTVSPTSGHTYTIANVSGNITVTATTAAIVNYYTITYDLVNATASSDITTIREGSSFTVTLRPNSGYSISIAAVTHDGDEVTPTSGHTYVIDSVRGNILVECVAAADASIENAKLTVLGKYSMTNAINQNGNSLTTSGTYSGANGGQIELLTNTDIDAAWQPTTYGETFLGWRLNGVAASSPMRITGDSVLAPRVKGNLAYVKYSGGKWNENKTVTTNSINYRTEIIPVVLGGALTIKIPNHANETVKIRTWYCSPYGTYSSTNSGLLSIALDSNGVGTINPAMTGHLALNLSYMADGNATVFTESDLKAIEINYACTAAWSVPAFRWEKVLDLGGVSTATGNNTWNQSAALYNGYMVTFSGTMRQMKVIKLSTGTVVATIINTNYQSDIHGNSACFLPKKYSESDYYPMLLTNVHTSLESSDKLTVFRLVGTTATSFTVQRICDWTFTNCLLLDNQVNGNILYMKARSSDTYPELRGLWRISMDFQDTSIYVDRTFDLTTMTGATRILASFYQRTGQDLALITQTGKDDIIVNSYGPTTDMPNKHAGLVFYRAGSTTGDLIGWLPTNRILNGYEHDGIIYAGNGELYCVLVNSSKAYLYKFTITIPEYA